MSLDAPLQFLSLRGRQTQDHKAPGSFTMFDTPKIATSSSPGQRLRSLLSLLSLAVALGLLAGTYFLMSPPSREGYPGAIPWRAGSLLKHLTDLMSLGGAVATIRGVEVKDFAFHLVTVAALVLLAARALVSGLLPPARRTVKGAWFFGQVFLAGWVLLSLASSQWSGDPELAWGQAALYGLALAWAIALAWTLESRDAPRLLWGYVIIAAIGAALCVWYFYERNPYHNPGFPIGNPNTLAACTLPAILIAGAVLIGSARAALRDSRALLRPRVIVAVLTLIPLCWCFRLTNSLGALMGLLIGVAGLLYLRAGRRFRWMFLAALLLGGSLAALYIFYAKQDFVQDFVMSRGATIRFRVYAWRYAAILWSERPIGGAGAGQYPCRASALSALTGDRALDPAAFPAEMVEHAHNELFEVFAEIGLVGGVTFVAGFLATLAAASALLRTSLSPERRWLLFGLVAGVIALLGDAMFGVGLRLPGLPAVFYTLLGLLWALCRSVSKQPSEQGGVTETWLRRMVVRRYGLTVASLGLAVLAGWLSVRNWKGVRYEQASDVAQRAGEYEVALAYTCVAEPRLLDPVRKLIADHRAVHCEFARAQLAYKQAVDAFERYQAACSDGGEADAAASAWREQFQQAEQLCRTASEAAVSLSQRAPDFGRMAALGAQCAEMLAALYDRAQAGAQAQLWRQRALWAWHSQRALRPFDVQTLLKLTEYLRRSPGSIGEYIGLLRDALREGVPPARFPPREWYQALRAAEGLRDFEPTLEAMVQAVGPYDPQTDLGALILSRAPEMYRLSAAWKALQGRYEGAASEAAWAVRLYRPMRTRFPELYSVGLAEQAEYAFQAQPDEPRRAVALLREAIHALPEIQKQKYEEMTWPYRLRLVRFLLAAGEEAEAADVLKPALKDEAQVTAKMADAYVELARTFLQRPPEDRPPVEPWLRAALRLQPDHLNAWALTVGMAVERRDAEGVRTALRDAEKAGVADADLEFLRNIAQQQMPELSEGAEDE
jgi:O-antigen ligase